MPWRDEIESALPPPRDDDPAHLRRDILDELADHLESAMDREMRRADDAAAARKRVLARFGSPQRIALKLWFDAMKERIMTQRILLGTNIAMFALLLVMFIIVLMALRQNQRIQADLIDKVAGLAVPAAAPPAGAADLSWPRAVVRVEGGQGPFQVELRGELYNPGESITLRRTIDEGSEVFGPMRPGRYVLTVTEGGGLQHRRSIVVPPGAEHEVVVAAPSWQPQPKMTEVRLDVPEDVAALEPIVHTELARHINHAGREWSAARVHLLLTADGRAAALDESPGIEYVRRASRHAFRHVIDTAALPFSGRVELDAAFNHIAIGLWLVIYVPLPDGEDDEYAQIVTGAGALSFEPEEIAGGVVRITLPEEAIERVRQSLERPERPSPPRRQPAG